MSRAYLGEEFDIHGGGLDLIFPHHENEICQSCAAHDHSHMAHYWMHNGYVTVSGEKMSKSLGNFVTMADLLDTTRGEIIRHSLLQAQYRGPLDFSLHALKESEAALNGLYRAVEDISLDITVPVDDKFLDALADDLNTPLALSRLHQLASMVNRGQKDAQPVLKRSAAMLGLLGDTATAWFQHSKHGADASDASMDDASIQVLIDQRNQARKERNFAEADRIRDQLAADGITLEDKAEGTIWRRS